MIRLGVIGTGPVVRHHLEVLRAIPGVEAVAIAGRRKGPRDLLARDYGIAETVEDYRVLLGHGGLDGILVLVAPDAIAEVARAALQTHIPTFLEKPPGLSYREAANLAECASSRGTLNMVGLNRRFYSTVTAAMDAVSRAGPLSGLAIHANEDLARARAAGRSQRILERWVYANSLHTIDLLRFLGGPLRNDTRDVKRPAARPPDAISIVATIETVNGAVATYESHWGSPAPWTVILDGRDTAAVLSPLEEGWTIRTIDGTRVRTALPIDEVDRSFKPGFLRQMEAFVESIRSGVPAVRPAADLADAAESMSLAAWMIGHDQ
jgi:predicted dehydrogenase